MHNIYSYPQYYEIAFSYRDIPKEVDIMEEAMARFSPLKVKRLLELASGNSPHMLEFIERGYEYSGLDLNETMLAYSREKARPVSKRARFYLADLANFQVEEPLDFIYIMLGSLYVAGTEALLSHFTSVERALAPGGLYFLDWCVDFAPLDYTQDSWVMRQGPITVKTHYSTRRHHAAEQLYMERLLLQVQDGHRQRRLSHEGLRRAIFPQEFLLAATKLHSFQFLGWWNDWDWQKPLEKVKGEIFRPITILRRT